ncbi:MAG: hypothetical protein QXY80_02800 [Candidatus Jordarchaeales archaeon]
MPKLEAEEILIGENKEINLLPALRTFGKLNKPFHKRRTIRR